MFKRHSGWAGHYLKKFLETTYPRDSGDNLRLSSYNTIDGVKGQLTRVLFYLNEYNKNITHKASIYRLPIFKRYNNLAIRPFFPDTQDATYVKYLNLIKLLVARSYRAKMIARLRPAHGQSRWHNANSAKFCNTFLRFFCMRYEIDLFKRRPKKAFKFSKIWEMRQKAKMRIKKKRKKYTKFKRFGERRLALKRGKKTPWD